MRWPEFFKTKLRTVIPGFGCGNPIYPKKFIGNRL